MPPGPSDILVVEDDELVQSFLCRALTGVAGEVVACDTGGDAFQMASTRRFGVILLDGLLPDMHGVELGKKLLAQEAAVGTPAMCIVSGMLRLPHPIREGIGALPKPLRVRELVATVDELLAWHRDTATVDTVARRAALDSVAVDLLVT